MNQESAMDNHSLKLNNHPGTYALLFECKSPFKVVVGKLGPVRISTGYWVYVGSAFGPGGLRSRLAHHLKSSPRPHWHLDYIKNALHLLKIWTTTDAVKREHEWAAAFSTLKDASRPIAKFGATDCACRSHLIHLHQPPSFTWLKKTFRMKKETTHGRHTQLNR
jgi:Uri superfamily endonuclease